MKLLFKNGRPGHMSDTQDAKIIRNVSLVCTVYNEGESIREFLQSVISMSRYPEELIIVDGGSTDSTVEKINSIAKNNSSLNIKLIQSETRINIARGRNIAISSAQHEIIAAIDAGCILDQEWLKNIVSPLIENEEVDVVGGWSEAIAETEFGKKVVDIESSSIDNENPDTFLPSSRSIAFRKKCWASVNGYPEWLTLSAEDTLYDLELRKAGFKFYFQPSAVARWKVRPNMRSLVWIRYSWGRGEGEARIYTLKYLARCATLLCPLFFFFTKKRFKYFGIRYLLYVSLITGWIVGLYRGVFVVSPQTQTLWKSQTSSL